ncbi:hypothetical protein G8E11_002332 [Salmonella enterica]|nr:hypothetical protein [Salmonella enterica]EEF7552673.1 hypothetical protein [Salmonella enterica subsp. diarizonae serovar 48:i:z]EEK3570665.1 hypothetical protein [Salmonella enterica]EEL0073264.1 hypothetical protein [Salmonella enterica]EEL1123880.1 hypothetical protein [Salmonella enterica]
MTKKLPGKAAPDKTDFTPVAPAPDELLKSWFSKRKVNCSSKPDGQK